MGEFCVLVLSAEEILRENLLLVSGPSGLLQKPKFMKEMTLGLVSGGGVYFPPGAGAGGEVNPYIKPLADSRKKQWFSKGNLRVYCLQERDWMLNKKQQLPTTPEESISGNAACNSAA